MNNQDSTPREVLLRGFRVDLAHHTLLDATSSVVELRPQALDLLCLLARNAGRVMEKQELQAQVWQGLVVTDDSLVQAIGDIRRAIDDHSHQIIRTVPRKGYRLIEQMPESIPNPEAVASAAELASAFVERRQTPTAHIARKVPSKLLWIWIAVIVMAGALVYWGWYLQQSIAPPRLSIVVLPFVNASGDASKEYIADSITEDITVQLSRIKGSFVIGRGTAFTYKGKAIDLKAIAKELNVRYVLQGTVVRSDAGYRITAELIDGTSGTNLWADSLTVSLDRPADIPEWVAAQLSNTLKMQLLDAEASSTAKRVRPDSVDLEMQAYSKFRNCWTLEACVVSYQIFDRVIQMDPANDTAHAHRILNAIYILLGWQAIDRPKLITQLNQDVEYLEGLGVLDSTGHRALARARYFQGRNAEALQQINESLEIDPNDRDALSMKTIYLVVNGQASSAIETGMKALAVSPRDPDRSGVYFNLCHANMHLGKFKDAIAWCEKSFSMAAGYWALTDLVAAYTALGDVNKAASSKALLLKMNPGFSIGFYKGLKLSSNPTWLKEIEENVWANLRQAGIPE
jgi:TolB-like protein/DNA-binding winged helix-turn-helix (wHTH) protein